jgi:hypothetical protein
MRLKVLLVGILLLICAWAMRDLTIPGLYTSHDGTIHVQRIVEFHKALNEGQIPPRWGGDFFDGLGSPVMILNYQLPYFVADGGVRLGLSSIDSFKFTMIFAYVASALVAFFVFSDLFGTYAGFAVAVMWVVAPYRFVDIYVRGAFGESFAFIFPPLILWAIVRKRIGIGILAMAALFLSHPVASALYSAFFVMLSMVLSIKEKSFAALMRFFLIFIVAFGIAGYNLIPSIFDTSFTQYTPQSSAPLEHFPALHQLIYSHWGYGFSTPNDDKDNLSYQVGITHWLTIVLVTGTLVLLLHRRKMAFFHSAKNVLAASAYVAFWISLVVMLKITTPVWINLHLVDLIDFPWRILMITIFFTALLCGWFISQFGTRWQIFFAILFVVCPIFFNRNHIRINAISPLTQQYLTTHLSTGDSNGEYASAFRPLNSQYHVTDRLTPVQNVQSIVVTKNTQAQINAIVNATVSGVIRLNVQYYPGWTVRYNGRDVTTTQCSRLTANSAQALIGLLQCTVPVGSTVVQAAYEFTPAQMAGIMLSLYSIFISIWLMYRSFFQRTTNARTSPRLSSGSPKSSKRRKKHSKFS